jgi:PmbA protein
MSALLDLAKSAISIARQKGANEASASTYRSRDVDIGWRDGKIERVSEATTRGLSIALYVDGRYSSVYTTDLRPEAVEKFIEDSIGLARTLAKDPYRGLPDPKRYEGRANVDLKLLDDAYGSLGPETRKALAKDLEQSARGVPGAEHIVSVTTGVSDNHTESAKATTNGFEGEWAHTTFWSFANVTIRDGDRRPEDWYSASSRAWRDLAPASEVGRRAAERALASRGAKKIESAVLPLVVENRAAGRLLGALLGALGGRALQQKQSFLEGKVGSQIASKLLTIVDDPLVPKGLGSRWWDGDGFAAKKMTVIEGGVLRMFYIDDYYGRKLKMPPTTGSASNLLIQPGKKDLDGILADVREAILVTSFLGGNSNGTTGDFSYGIQGHRIRAGQRAEPIAEMNIAGNQKEFWKKLVMLGNDPYPYSSVRVPSLVFDGVQFAGA